MLNRLSVAIGVALSALAIVASAGWYRIHEHEHLLRDELKQVLQRGVLEPIAERVKENAALTRELESPPFTEPGSDALQSYLVKIRRDGFPKNAPMRQRLDEFANRNTEIVVLLAVYARYSQAPAFAATADRFREYTVSFRDRWQSLPEIFMVGGNLPATPPFPSEIATVVQAEISRTNSP